MSKLNLQSLVNLQNENTATTRINSNSLLTEDAIENTLSRDGTSPNQMEASLDMNSNRILNLPTAISEDEPVTLSQMVDALVDAGNINIGATTVAVSSAMQPVVAASTLATARSLLNVYEITPELYGAVGDGATDDYTAIQAAIDAAGAASGGGTVKFLNKTYVSGTALKLRSKVTLQLNGATIIRKASSFTTYVVECDTYSAHNAMIFGGTIDGNRANNNTDDPSNSVVRIGTANNVTVRDCTVQNSNGDGITVTTGLKPRIVCNNISNIFAASIGIFGTGSVSTSAFIFGNNLTTIGEVGILLKFSDYNVVLGNKLSSTFIGGSQAPMVVNISGTTVTWVSGPTFANAQTGMFLIANSSAEYFITAKASSTSLSINTSVSATGITGAIGAGDLISVGNSSYNLISNNVLSRGVSLGISLFNHYGTENCQNNTVTNNIIEYIGNAGISLQTTADPSVIVDTLISGNKIYRPGVNSAGSVAGIMAGFYLNNSASGNILTTIYTNNTVYDDLGNLRYGAIISGAAAGEVGMFGNQTHGAINTGVSGSVTTLSGAMVNL